MHGIGSIRCGDAPNGMWRLAESWGRDTLPDSPTPSNPTPIQDPLLLFMQAVQVLTQVATTTADRNTSSSRTKVHKPDTFNGTDLRKLCASLMQCELNFQD